MRLRLGVLVCLAIGVAVPARAAVVVPRVALSGDPVVVRGFNFFPREQVRVTVGARGAYSKRIVALRNGSFRTSFPLASVEGCGAFTVSAIGSLGSRAYLKRTVGCLPTGP